MHTPDERAALIAKIRSLPQQLETLVSGLTDEQLDFSPGSREWSARQIVHHVADSHMNAFIRLKLAITENHPTIKAYDQELWAELPDTKHMPLEPSFSILRGLHQRWVAAFESLSEDDWNRTARHPEYGTTISPDTLVETYAEHGEIHLDQIRRALAAQGIDRN
jgi:hypothetical protein